MVAGSRERFLGRGFEAGFLEDGPVVVEVQRCAVVYEPEFAVPDQEVRVARGTIHVGHERVEPEDAGGEVRVGLSYERVEAQRARQVIQGKVEAGAGPEQVLYLGVRLGSGRVPNRGA